MIKRVVEAIFGARQDREVKRLQPIIAQIHEHEKRLATLDEAELKGQTERFRGQIAERTHDLRTEVDRLDKNVALTKMPDSSRPGGFASVVILRVRFRATFDRN